MAAVNRCLVLANGTTNDKFMALAIALKGLPELAGAMGEELEPYIRYWYEQSLPFMQEQDWQQVWERWLYLWVWAKPGHDMFRLAFEAVQAGPLPPVRMQYPSNRCGNSSPCVASFSTGTRTSAACGT